MSFKEKLGYGLGDTASHFVWDMVGFWLLIFYTDVYKIPPAAAGTIMLIARFWDMGIDPVIGIISDRTQTRWGKFRPYILFRRGPLRGSGCPDIYHARFWGDGQNYLRLRHLRPADDRLRGGQSALFFPGCGDDLGHL